MPTTNETGDTSTTSDVTVTDNGSDNTGTNDIPSEFAELSLEELLNADLSDDPILGQEHKGLPSYGEILKHLPENGRKLIANLRSMTTKKTQELADARKQLEDERAEVLREKESLYAGKFAKEIADKANESTEDIDLYDEAGLNKRIEIETAKRLQALLAPAQQEIALAKRQAQLDDFKRANPDLTSKELRLPIAELLVQRPDLKLEDAYHIVKGRITSEKLAEEQASRKATTTTRKENLLKTSGGSSTVDMKAPKGMSAWEAFQYHKNNGMK